LEVEPDILKRSLLNRVIQTGGHRGSTINVPQTPEQACVLRDALAKALYDRQFDWIVGKINAAMQKNNSKDKVVISVLDIYGFEIFDV
jgi:myosin-1